MHPMTTAQVSSVWGKPKGGGVESSARVGGLDGLESCAICREDVPASVLFRPCGHKMCFDCVQKSRVRNIYLADKGVKCPFCKQYIEEYVSLDGDPRANNLLQRANAAAAKAAVARQPEECDSEEDSMSSRRWKCLHCNTQNSGALEMCVQCARLKPEVVVPQPPKGKDLLKYSVDEILAASKAKWHPNLNKAFLEAGVPISLGKVTGTEDSIVTALKKFGHGKLLMIIRAVAGTGQIIDLCHHLFGNYTVQDLMEAAAKLREVAADTAKYGLCDDAVQDVAGVKVAFRLLVNSLLDSVVELSVHQRCSFVIQRMVSLCGVDELIDVARRLHPHIVELACDEKGCHVLHHFLRRLKMFVDGSDEARVRDLANEFAGALYNDFERMKWLTNHSLVGGKILLEVVSMALPGYEGLQVASILASNAGDLVHTKAGMRFVLGLLSLDRYDVRNILRDLVCCVAISLQGQFATYAMYEPISGEQVVKLCLQRLEVSSETKWMEIITEELVAKADELLASAMGSDVLSKALSFDGLQQQTAEMFIKRIAAQGIDTRSLESAVILGREENIVEETQEVEPRHWGPSVLHPWLKYHIENGNEIQLPPPPPPRSPLTAKQLPPIAEEASCSMQGMFQPPPQVSLPTDQAFSAPPHCSIWTSNGGFPPGLPTPPLPKPYVQSAVPGAGEGHLPVSDNPAAAKLPADLMDSLNSFGSEGLAEEPVQDRQGLLGYGISAPPPAMYSGHYPGNWNFPDNQYHATEQCADLDVTEVINQFQDATLEGDSRGVVAGEGFGGSVGAQNGHLGENREVVDEGQGSALGDLPEPLHRLFPQFIQNGSGYRPFGGGPEGNGDASHSEGHSLDQVDERNDSNAQQQVGPTVHVAWTCKICTYEHMGQEAEFLTCAMCGSTKGKNSYLLGRVEPCDA